MSFEKADSFNNDLKGESTSVKSGHTGSSSLDVFFMDETAARKLEVHRKRRVVLHASSSEISSESGASNGSISSGSTGSGSETNSSDSESSTHSRGRHGHRKRKKRRSRTKRGRLNAAILEETEDYYPFEVESYPRRYFRTSSTSPPPAGRTKDPIAPGIYTRIRKRSATPMDFDELFSSSSDREEGQSERSFRSPLGSILLSASESENLALARKDTITTVVLSSNEKGQVESERVSRATNESQSPTGLPIIQEFILDSQFSIIVEGRRFSFERALVYYILAILSFGILPLLSKWFPIIRATLTTKQTSLATSTHVLVTNSYKQRELISVRRTYYGNLLSEVFGKQIVHEYIVQDEEEKDDEEEKEEIESVKSHTTNTIQLEEIVIEPNEDILASKMWENEKKVDFVSDRNSTLSVKETDSDIEDESEVEELVYTHNVEAYPAPVDHVEVKDTDSISSSFYTLNQDIKVGESFQPQPNDYLYFFEYRCIRFLYHPNTGRYFENSQWDTFHGVTFDKLRAGLSEGLASQRRVIFDENLMTIGERSLLTLFMDEVFHPFNVFQLASIILWCFENYQLYATAIFLMSAFSSAMTMYETRKNMRYIDELSRHRGTVNILREGYWQEGISVADLVPGDIFEVELDDAILAGVNQDNETDENDQVPCDALLLEGGDCIVNESMLTGESFPISKIAMDLEKLDDLVQADLPVSQHLIRYYEKSVIYAGTKLIRVRREIPSEEEDLVLAHTLIAECGRESDLLAEVNRESVLKSKDLEGRDESCVNFGSPKGLTGAGKYRLTAVAIRTGFNTTKGNLIRTILFPRPTHFKFYRDSIRFVGILGGLSMFGFFWSVHILIVLGQSLFHIITKACDMITIAVPPALPASMSVGANFSLIRLKQKAIYCIAPSRINVAGKVNLICFDKTGTLTEDSLDLLGIHCIGTKSSITDEHGKVDLTKEDLCSVYVSDCSIQDLDESCHESDELLLGPLLYENATNKMMTCETLYPRGPQDYHTLLFMAMGTCHTLKKVQGVLIGDPLELKMFKFTGLLLDEGIAYTNTIPDNSISTGYRATSHTALFDNSHLNSSSCIQSSSKTVHASSVIIKAAGSHSHECLRIVKSFEFFPELRRQSVVVKHYGENDLMKYTSPFSSYSRSPSYRTFAFVKGSPEEIKDLCRDVPSNYDALLDHYTFRGYRVLAVAFKPLNPGNNITDPNGTCTTSNNNVYKRASVESDLLFLGFLVFENRLKSATLPALKILKESAKLRTLMCTGDNILTAISVAKASGMVVSNATFFVPFLMESERERENEKAREREKEKNSDSSTTTGSDHGELHIRWASSLDSRHVLSSTTLQPIYQAAKKVIYDSEITSLGSTQHSDSTDLNSCFPQGQQYTIACTGRILEYLIDYCHPAVLQRVLLTCSVYARLSPNQKQRLVECLQRLDYTVAFCGDGANDCGALKASDIGISLSEAEASVAAPFTCSRPDIHCVVDILREGRSSLVTSFSIFKYMALYSLIQFNSVLLLYNFGSNLGDAQFAYVDLIIIIPLAITMNRLEATCSNLHHRTPTANLISKRVLSSLFSQLFICLGFQYSLYHFLVRQSWYLPIPFSAFSDNILGQLNTALFSFTVFQYVIVAFVFTNNQPHQRPVYTNLPFMLVACVVTLWNFVFLLFPSPRVATFMELVPLPFNFRLFLLAMVFLNCVVSFIADRGSLILLKWFLTHLKKIQLFQDYFLKHHAKNRKIYKKILSDLEPDPCRV